MHHTLLLTRTMKVLYVEHLNSASDWFGNLSLVMHTNDTRAIWRKIWNTAWVKANGRTGPLDVQQVQVLSQDLSLQVYFKGDPVIHCRNNSGVFDFRSVRHWWANQMMSWITFMTKVVKLKCFRNSTLQEMSHEAWKGLNVYKDIIDQGSTL